MGIEDKSFEIMVVGKGKEFFEPISQENEATFTNNNLYLGVGEGFSAPEITNVMISIGIGVISALSAHYLVRLIESIFNVQCKAKDNGVNMTINVTIVNGDQYIQLGSDKDQIKKRIIKAEHKEAHKGMDK